MFVAIICKSSFTCLYTGNELGRFKTMGQRSYCSVPDPHGASCGRREIQWESEQERNECKVLSKGMKEKNPANLIMLNLSDLSCLISNYNRAVLFS